MITIEYMLWLSFLVGTASMVGSKIVTPLIDQAQRQATLNADSLALIEQALLVCGGGS